MSGPTSGGPAEGVERTAIPGLLVVPLAVHRDDRGWFKENWHRQRMTAQGLPDFGPVQHNLAFNVRRGVTRGIHAEPWDKLVSVATGRVFGAWVDLREGATFGTVVHRELDPGSAVFVPRGVGNAYQALEDQTSYSYLVNDHWVAGQDYPMVNPGDAAVGVPWPIPLDEAELSAKDLAAPGLEQVTRFPSGPRVVVLGAGGQLGRALTAAFPGARAVTRAELDVSDADAVAAWSWSDHDVVLNAAAYTAVDAAETPEGRPAAWAANAVAPALLARQALDHRLTVVHYSTDYVFDGAPSGPAGYREDAPVAPLGVYGQSKAAGELALTALPSHFVLRTSWVVGDGANFVRTMAALAARGASPAVVADQVGRLTFATELARATRHLLDRRAAYGTYHVTGAGPEQSWLDVARQVFELCGRAGDDVAATSTEEYGRGKALAPRPTRSTMDLTRIHDTGFVSGDPDDLLSRYVAGLRSNHPQED